MLNEGQVQDAAMEQEVAVPGDNMLTPKQRTF